MNKPYKHEYEDRITVGVNGTSNHKVFYKKDYDSEIDLEHDIDRWFLVLDGGSGEEYDNYLNDLILESENDNETNEDYVEYDFKFNIR